MSLVCEAYVGDEKKVEKLLNDKVYDVNDTDAYGDSALHAAAQAGRYITVNSLIKKYNADVNLQNGVGSTPLHKAVISNNVPIISLLIKNGADATIANDAGFRPEDYTDRRDIKLLLKGDSLITKKIKIPKSKHARLIGRQGSTLNKIRAQSGTEIKIPKAEDSTDLITIMGREDEIEKAIKLIDSFLKNETEKPNLEDIPEGWTATEIMIEPSKYGYIIGHKGNTIQNIISTTGVTIYVPPPSKRNERVVVKGPVDSVDEAVRMIFDAMPQNEFYNNKKGS